MSALGLIRDGSHHDCGSPQRYGADIFLVRTQTLLKHASAGSVERIESYDVCVGAGTWTYAHDHAASIEAHWLAAKAAAPFYFNGVIHLIDEIRVEAGVLHAQLLRTDFKSYLYWRARGYPDAGVLDGFGSALLRSSDGAIMLGRQRPGNINGGLVYLPGGFIDQRDIAAGGSVDLAGSIARELLEETGLALSDLNRRPGYYLTCSKAQVSIAAEFVSGLKATPLKDTIEQHISTDAQSELTDVIVVRGLADLVGLDMPHYARLLVADLLAEPHGLKP